jgi:DDE superfamily endonuclease/Tc5 transposase DNA-binding domain
VDAIIERRLKKEKVTRAWIAAQALHLYASIDDGPVRRFEASHQWVSCFMRRNDLSLRRRTNLTPLTDEQLVGRAISYMRYLREHQSTYNFKHTVLMDETAVYFEDAREQTVEVRGARHVVVKATGFASMRVTAILAVTAEGVKLPPVVIWKHAKGSRKLERLNGCYIAFQAKAWVDSELISNWIDSIFPRVLQADGKAIVWDSMRAHISKAVKAKCASRDIAMCVIPGGLTPYLQAGDIGIYRQFKDLLCASIDSWKNSDDVQYTRGGNPRPPSEKTVCGWVAKAWKDTPQLAIDNSIVAAGFHSDPCQWHIWRHDVYGALFQQGWAEPPTSDAEDEDVDDELANALDDIELVDE